MTFQPIRDCSLLISGTTLEGGTILIESRLKGLEGGFGQIYQGVCRATGTPVIIKAEPTDAAVPLFSRELQLLRKLRGRANCVQLITYGTTPKCRWVATRMAGPSLNELRRNQPGSKFSQPTAARLAIQMLKGLEQLHLSGFVHRDVKPHNFVVDGRQVCLLDFGLCRSYVTPTGELKPPRFNVGFRGTVRYASIPAHQGNDLSRADDLTSLFYVLIEMFVGELPWHSMSDRRMIGSLKVQYSPVILAQKAYQMGTPRDLLRFANDLKCLSYYSRPDYDQLQQHFYRILARHPVDVDDPYEWESESNSNVQSLLARGGSRANVTGCRANRSGNGVGRSYLPTGGGSRLSRVL